jgi:hypothetical protein
MHTLDSAAEWFLRLNGFLTVLNFVVHPVETEEGTQQRTDADVLGVRLRCLPRLVLLHGLRSLEEFESLLTMGLDDAHEKTAA